MEDDEDSYSRTETRWSGRKGVPEEREVNMRREVCEGGGECGHVNV